MIWYVAREGGKIVTACQTQTPECTEGPLAEDDAEIVAFFTVPIGSVKMWQAKIALSMTGKLDTANAAIAASGNTALQLAWEYAADLSRTSPGMAAVAQAIGLSEAEVDQLFLTASQIQV